MINIYGSAEGRDLGGVARDIDRIVDSSQKELPRGSRTIVRGQIATMRSSFLGLLAGVAFSIVLVYLLIVVNFQSWLDPLIIISALPAALAGIIWFLFRDRQHHQRAGPDWFNHVRWRCHLQQHSGGQLRA